MSEQRWSTGSNWQRWDPHLHAPGTVHNDQFGNDWEGYFQAIANAEPAPVALGITDYYTLRTYKRFLEHQNNPPFDRIPLVFPNIEIRLAIPGAGNSAINAHLLIDPTAPNYIRETEDLLSRLSMVAVNGQSFICRDDKLMELGRASARDPSISDEKALREGAKQFKVSPAALTEAIEQSSWSRTHVLLAIAGGKDGLSGGRRRTDGWEALVSEAARKAHIIFSATPSDGTYWQKESGNLTADGQSTKPCLHGSDAHSIGGVLRPEGDRYCWLRTEPSFEGLRQVLAEPARRVYIGASPPDGPPRGELIRALDASTLRWISNDRLEFNSGLVTIIGARGSGKTAIADLLAYGAFSDDEKPGSASFLNKAERHVRGGTFALEWADEARAELTIDLSREKGVHEPRVRYLSQQFVEQLCNPAGDFDALVDELERVVFQTLSLERRKGCGDFAGLRQLELERSQTRRSTAEREVEQHTALIGDLARRRATLPVVEGQIDAASREIKSFEDAIRQAPRGADPEIASQQRMVYEELTGLESSIASSDRKIEEIDQVMANVEAAHAELERTLADLRATHVSGLGEETVAVLKVPLPSSISDTFRRAHEEAIHYSRDLRCRGRAKGVVEESLKGRGIESLRTFNTSLLKRLNIGVEQSKKLARSQTALGRAQLKKALAEAELSEVHKCNGLIEKTTSARLQAYRLVLDELDAEQGVLEALYEPLRNQIANDERLSKLSFAVARRVNAASFLEKGRALFKERQLPDDQTLESILDPLFDAWAVGSAEQSYTAMDGLLNEHAKTLVNALRANVTRVDFGRWLFSTTHLSIEYSIRYEETPLEKLSPGTRGVVLLTLFLGIDVDDGRPLIIDQPEENLDPKSVYDDLVPFFCEAATRRQIVMVTHNANLVVNTDADQIIVASAHRASADTLPVFTYVAGGLEDPAIRQHVCSILEGGEQAFQRRSRRYDVHL